MLQRALIGLLRVAGPRRTPDPRPPERVRSVLLAEMTRLGDLIASLPAARQIAGYYPEAAVHLFVQERFASLIEALSSGLVVHGIRKSNSWKGFLPAMAGGRALRVTLACSMSPSNRNASLVLASGAPYMAGYLAHAKTMTPHLTASKIDTRGFLSADVQGYWMENIYERSFKICRALHICDKGRDEMFTVRADLREEIRDRLQCCGILPRGRFVVVHPFSGWAFKNWPPARFVSLMEALGDVQFVVLCAENERGALQVFESLAAQTRRVRLFASGDLVETAVLLQEASLLVGNDSGPLHLAAMLGTRVIGLYGAASPLLTAPRTPDSTYLFHPVECSPCPMRTCFRAQHRCMELLTVEEVVETVRSVLGAAAEQEFAPHA